MSSEKLTKRQKIENYIDMVYDFRFNTIKSKPEFSPKNQNKFKPMDDYIINTLIREIDKDLGINSSKQVITSIIESTFSPQINPVKHWLTKLKPYDPIKEMDYIKEFSSFVPTVQTPGKPDMWPTYFKKWLVGVVANIFDDNECRNHLCLVLSGGQGTYKTTFLELLVPPGLKEYLFSGKIDPQNKDSETYLAEYMIINIDDQLRELNKKDENQLKNLITKSKVKYRRPYAAYIDEYPHLASFCASVNGNDFLTDTTGNRRFLPFEVEGKILIDQAQAFDISNVYRQCMHLYKNKFQYWISSEEAKEQADHLEKFNVVTTEEELILKYFIIPENTKRATHELTNSDVISHIQTFETKALLSAKRIGEAFTKLGLSKRRKTTNGNTIGVYGVIMKDAEDVRNQTRTNYVKNPYHEPEYENSNELFNNYGK